MEKSMWVVGPDRRTFRIVDGEQPVVLDLSRAGAFQVVAPNTDLWREVLKIQAAERPGG